MNSSLSIRFIVRPRGILTTPKKLKEVLEARCTVAADRPKRFSENEDFFLAYPSIPNATAEYKAVRQFSQSDKLRQRMVLFDVGVPVPDTFGLTHTCLDMPSAPYIARPLRHRAGQGWRLTNEIDHNAGTHYLSVLFPKKYEYRVIYCRGQRVSTMIKRVPPSLGADAPWNHANGCSFETVNSVENDRLRHTDCYEKLANLSVIKNADLVAADVLLGRNSYVVCELNFAPAISIPQTLTKIKEIVDNANL